MTLTLTTAVPERDRWDRPVIDGQPHTRISTLAKTLSDQTSLIAWASRMTAVGLAQSDDLVAAVATTSATDRYALDKLVERAQERAQARRGATMGTALHSATQMADEGVSEALWPAGVRADVEAYRDACAHHKLRPLACEVFVVCPELRAAGTLDRIMQGPTRALVADLKTSGNPDSAKYEALAWAIQVATYAHGHPWHHDHGHMTWDQLGLPQPDLRRGLVIHITQGTAKVAMHSVDLTLGWQAAHLATQVRDMRKAKTLTTIGAKK